MIDVTITSEQWNNLWDVARSQKKSLNDLLLQYNGSFLHNNGITWTIRFQNDRDVTYFVLKYL